ncbi:MAG: LON peptidase substrate-binding domain-containing protein [Spirochaetota bacterium]
MVTLRIFYCYNKVLFPHCGITLPVKHKWLANQFKPGDTVIVYPVKRFKDYVHLTNMGVLAEVLKIELLNKQYVLSLKGLSRVRINKRHGLWSCSYSIIDEKVQVNAEITEKLRKKAQELIFLINVDESDKLIHLLNFISDAVQLSDFIANYFILDYNERVALLNNADVTSRINTIIQLLTMLIDNIQHKRRSEG